MLRVYIGWDPRDAAAFEVCRYTLLLNSSTPIEVVALKDWELRAKQVYFRPYNVDETGQRWDGLDGTPFSTDFSFTRFCVPGLENFGDDLVIFCDPDILWRRDVVDLLKLADPRKAMMCVKHVHKPLEKTKAVGLQTIYRRKNWSSLMILRPSRCRSLNLEAVNTRPGWWLHGMSWLGDDEIGGLPESWNWLEGWSSPAIKPDVIHYTRGTPDMPGYEDVSYASEWLDALQAISPAGAASR